MTLNKTLLIMVFLFIFCCYFTVQATELRLEFGDWQWSNLIEQIPATTLRYYSTKPAMSQWELGGFVLSFNLILVDEPLYNQLHDINPIPKSAWSIISFFGEPILHMAAGTILGAIGSEIGEDLFYATMYNNVHTVIIKQATGMARPYHGVGVVFKGPFYGHNYTAMPSGHTSSSFAVATVLAEHYPDWKPVLYLTATAVGLSRIFLSKHWPSNVALGAWIGYISAKHYLQQVKE